MKTSNLILLGLLGVALFIGLWFITSVKKEFVLQESIEIESNEEFSERSVSIEAFESIKVFDQITLIIEEGNKSLSFSAPENVLPHMKAEVKDDVLNVFIDTGFKVEMSKDQMISAKLSYPTINKISANNQSNIILKNKMIFESLELEINDQAGFHGIVEAKKLDILMDKQSSAKVSGIVDELSLSGRSQTNFDGFNLEVQVAKIDLSQQSEAEINVKEELNAELRNASKLRYRGNPEVQKINNSKQSSVKKSNI